MIGQPIVIDDIAFNILANTAEMTMEFLPEGIELLKESDAGTDRKLEEPVPGLNEAEIIDVNHEENEDDKAGYKSNDEESMNEDNTIEEEPDQQHEDELDVVQNYNCDTCGQVFNSKKRLRKHMIKKPGWLVAKMKHTPTKKYACEICERTFRKSKTK